MTSFVVVLIKAGFVCTVICIVVNFSIRLKYVVLFSIDTERIVLHSKQSTYYKYSKWDVKQRRKLNNKFITFSISYEMLLLSFRTYRNNYFCFRMCNYNLMYIFPPFSISQNTSWCHNYVYYSMMGTAMFSTLYL